MHNKTKLYLEKIASEFQQLKGYISSGGTASAPPNLYDMIGTAMNKMQNASYNAGAKGYELYDKLKNKNKSNTQQPVIASYLAKQSNLQTSIPGETPEQLYNRIVSRGVNINQFFQNAVNHDWKIPGVPGVLARSVLRKAKKNPEPYIKSLVNKVKPSTVIEAIKKNPDAFKNVTNKTLNNSGVS